MDFLQELLTEQNRTKIANRLFYLAFMIELILMIVEKSELNFSMESYVFRITFVISMAAVICLRHDKKEWLIILLVWAFTFVCYRFSGKNELLRYATFIMAAKNINLGKTMKAMFYTSLAGFSLIVLLAIAGVQGNVAVYSDYGRDVGEELRYVFGFGHPNTLWGCVFALILLWIWIYGSKAKWWSFVILFASNLVLYKLTASRTSMLVGMLTILLAVIVRYMPHIGYSKYTYILSGIVTPVFCAAFSVWAAIVCYIPGYHENTKSGRLVAKLDGILNNRIGNLYRSNSKHAGALVSWKMFSDRESVEYFDMGWVRLFYWYGIIPAAIICILLIVFIYLCYKRKDAWTLLLVLALSIYTVIEATFVSVYIGRCVLLPVLGVYFGSMFERKSLADVDKK